MKKNIKSLIRKELLNEQFGGYAGYNCESGSAGCNCTEPVFGTGQFYDPINGTPQSDLADCINADNCCKKWDCYSDGAGVCEAVNNFNAQFNTEAECLAVHPNGCAPQPDDYDCVLRDGSYFCVPTPGGQFTGINAMADCNAAVAAGTNGCAPQADAYECDVENCRCYADPSGSFTGPTAQADCNAALSDPDSECCCVNCDPVDPCEELVNDPQYAACCEQCIGAGGPLPVTDPCAPYCKCCERFDCVEDKSGNMSCISVPNGPFTTMADCQAALSDPDSKCNRSTGGDKYDCKHGSGCFSTPNGPYDTLQACEDARDDHYNMGLEFCECECPGQPDGCDNTPLISPIMNNNGELGPLGQPLDLQILLTSAFRNRMAPCGPSYNAPLGRVKHDCKFWEYISTKKLPIDVWNNKVMVANPNSYSAWHNTYGNYPWAQGSGTHQGTSISYCSDPAFTTELDCTGNGHDWITGTSYITNQGQVINPYSNPNSSTPHPRWQRKIEAKIAYVRCLRQACCGNTEWPNDGDVFIPTL